MSHYAQVKNGLVQRVIVAEQEFIDTLTDAGDWIQTSYNTRHGQHTLGGQPLRGNYAGPGFVYDAVNDVFYPPQPFASWNLNTTTWTWQSPVPHPNDGQFWGWNENEQQWELTPGLGQ